MIHDITNLWNRLLVRVHPRRCHLLTAQVEDGDSVKTIYRAISEEQATLLIESALEAGLPGWAELENGHSLPINQPWQIPDDFDLEEEDLDLTEEEREILMEQLRAMGYEDETPSEDDEDDPWGLFE